MKWIGLTGGIGSGKSTVGQVLREFGYPVLDADIAARVVIRPGTPGLLSVAKAFGPEIFNAAGEIDRMILSKKVFGNPVELSRLEKILHPLIRDYVANERSRLERCGFLIAFYDVPLLFEKKMEDGFEAIVVVKSSTEQQIERVMNRNLVTRDQVMDRLSHQIPLEEKILRADYVIDNSGQLTDLKSEIQKMLRNLKSSNRKTK